MSINKVALIGATGNIGAPVLKALLDQGFEVTILSREGSNSTDSLASHPNQKVTKVNFEDTKSLVSALEGIEGVVSNVASQVLLSQKMMIDAAIEAGVKRFIPSDFGADLDVEANKQVPFNAPKEEIHNYMIEKSKAHSDFSYTFVTCGPFLDWSLQFGLFGDLKNHQMTLWDGGETKFSTTTLASVGKAVTGVFKHPEATKNRHIRIADATLTQKQIMEIVKDIDGQEWTTSVGSTAEAYQAGMEEFMKPAPNYQFAIVNQLYRIMFCPDFGTDFSDKLDNDKVGLSFMTEEQVKNVVKEVMA